MNHNKLNAELNVALAALQEAEKAATEAGLSPDDRLRIRELFDHVLFETKRVKNLDRYAAKPRSFVRRQP